jgi:integrase
LQQAVLHQAIASNPIRELERIESPKGHRTAPPRGLTAEERRKLFAFVDQDKVAVGADLPDLIRFAIGSGLRIGELCAVRWMDLDLDGIPVVSETDMRLVPVVAVRQNVYPVKGKGLTVHGGKTATALRIVPLPQLVTSRLWARRHSDDDPSWPVFAAAGRDGQPTYRWPSNARRSVRVVREQVGLEWMTPDVAPHLRDDPRRRDESHRSSKSRPEVPEGYLRQPRRVASRRRGIPRCSTAMNADA